MHDKFNAKDFLGNCHLNRNMHIVEGRKKAVALSKLVFKSDDF